MPGMRVWQSPLDQDHSPGPGPAPGLLLPSGPGRTRCQARLSPPTLTRSRSIPAHPEPLTAMAPSVSRTLMVPRPPNPPAAAAKSSRRHCRHCLFPASLRHRRVVTRQHGAFIGCPALYGGSIPVFRTGMLLGAAMEVAAALPVARWRWWRCRWRSGRPAPLGSGPRWTRRWRSGWRRLRFTTRCGWAATCSGEPRAGRVRCGAIRGSEGLEHLSMRVNKAGGSKG